MRSNNSINTTVSIFGIAIDKKDICIFATPTIDVDKAYPRQAVLVEVAPNTVVRSTLAPLSVQYAAAKNLMF